MRLDEFIQKRNYVKETINAFAGCVKSSENDAFHMVSMSLKRSADVARCLGWLEAMFDSIYEGSEIGTLDMSYALDKIYSDEKYLA